MTQETLEPFLEALTKIIYQMKISQQFKIETFISYLKNDSPKIQKSCIIIINSILLNMMLKENEYKEKLNEIYPSLASIFRSKDIDVLYTLSSNLAFLTKREEKLYNDLVQKISCSIPSFYLGVWAIQSEDYILYTILNSLKLSFLNNDNFDELLEVKGLTKKLIQKLSDTRFENLCLIILGYLCQFQKFHIQFLAFDGLNIIMENIKGQDLTKQILSYRILANLMKTKRNQLQLVENDHLDYIFNSISKSQNSNLHLVIFDFLRVITNNRDLASYILKRYFYKVLDQIDTNDEMMMESISFIILNFSKTKNSREIVNNNTILEIVSSLKSSNQFIKRNFAQTILHLSADQEVKEKLRKSKVLDSIELLQEDEDENVSKVANYIMENFQSLKERSMNDITEKKKQIQTDFIAPFEMILIGLLQNPKFEVLIEWDYYDQLNSNEQREYIHILKISLWNHLKSFAEAFYLKHPKEMMKIQKIILKIDKLNDIDIKETTLFIHLSKKTISIHEFIIKIEKILDIKNEKEIFISGDPKTILMQADIDDVSIDAFQKILSNKFFNQMNVLYTNSIKQMNVQNIIKSWHIKSLGKDQIKSNFLLLTFR